MTSKMFTRLGKMENVKRALDMLREFDPKIERKNGIITVWAPDGDIVFQALPKGNQGFILRYHEDVFER